MQRTKYRVIELNLEGEPLVYEFSSKPTYTNTVHGFDAAFDSRDSRTFKKSVNLSDENFQKIQDIIRYYLNRHSMRYRDFETRVLSNFISTKRYVYETIEELDKFLSGWNFYGNQDVAEDVKIVKDANPENLEEMNLQEMIKLRDELNKRIQSSNVHVSVDFDLPAGAYAFKMRENGDICVDWVQGGFGLFRLEIDDRILVDSDHIKLKPKLVKL